MDCSKALNILWVILRTLTIVCVYGVTMSKYYVHHGHEGVPDWLNEKLSPLYVTLAFLAAFSLFFAVVMCVYIKYPRRTVW